jgi:hypothetical protein
MALAQLHLSVCTIQTMGPQLATVLQRVAEGGSADPIGDIRRLLNTVRLRGNGGSFGEHEFAHPSDEDMQTRLQKLFLVVPCIEEAIERLGTLLNLFDRLQAAKVGDPDIKVSRRCELAKQSSANGEEDELGILEDNAGVTRGEIDIVQEDSQELIEAAAIAEAPKPSAKASARPASASRRGGRSDEANLQAKLRGDNEENATSDLPQG